MRHKKKRRIEIDNHVLFVRQSPEPNDIIWENLGLNLRTYLILRLKSTLFTFILWICCVLMIALIKWFQGRVLKEAIKQNDKSSSIYNIVRIISFLIGIIIICFNKFVLGSIVKAIVRFII